MGVLAKLKEGLVDRVTRPAWQLAIVALAVVLLGAVEALARAGGGGNYVGGGGGGFDGGGGGDVGDVIGLIYLVIAYPEVGIPLVIVVVAIGIVKRALNPDRRTARAVKRLEEIGPPDTSGIAGIKSRDPGFDEAKFLDRVRQVEGRVQEAWTRTDMVPVRTMLSDGLLRRFETQLAIMRHQSLRNGMADHKVLEARVHAVEQDQHFDTIHVALRATARDVEVDANLSYEEAARLAARAPQETYTEIWSFLRRPGAKTLAGGGAIDGQCPNCGAPFEVGQTSRCAHCQALINSGEHDWVLAEITQPQEWRPASTGAVPGLDQLTARDPGFNRQAAEDRGSYVFWRWIEALVLADAKPLAKCATAELRARVLDQVKAGPASHFKTAVGAVDLVGCAAGPDGGRDQYHVKVLWSSARSNKAQPTPAANVLTLGRKAGAVDRSGLSHARCPSCQGPLTENDSSACDYCGADLAAGDAEWVLEQVRRPEEIRVAAPVVAGVAVAAGTGELPAWATPDMGNPRERTLLLMRMAAVVMADGVVTKQERKLLQSASKRWGVPLEAVEPILRGEVDPGELATMRPSNPGGFLTGLIAAALIDGRIDAKEEKLLLDVSRNLGLSDADTRNQMSSMAKLLKAG